MTEDEKHPAEPDNGSESTQKDAVDGDSREYGIDDLALDSTTEGESLAPSSVDPEEETMDAIDLAQVSSLTNAGLGVSAPHDDSEHIGHTAPLSLLAGVLVALVLLTILTVGVTAIDLGAQGNFIVAMIIATVKAILVMGYFMHLFWDSKFNVVVFCSSFLFAALFFAMTLLDRQETQASIDQFELDKKLLSLGAK